MDRHPRETYEARLKERQGQLAEVNRLEDRAANLRLLTFVSFLILLALAFLRDLSFSWLLIPTGAFVGLIVYHQRLKGRQESLQRSLAHYEQALRRLDGTWVGRGTTGEAYLEEGHLYAFDLDIFGPGSLFELLCLARTRTGEQTLAQWLSRPASWEEIPKRQEAITELTDRLDLREELAVLGEQVRTQVDPDLLIRWGGQPDLLTGTFWARHGRLAAILLSVAAVATLVTWFGGVTSVSPLLVVFLLQYGLRRALGDQPDEVTRTVQEANRELTTLSLLLDRFEREPVRSGKLVWLKERLRVGGENASARIRSLDQLVAWLDARLNQLFAPFAYFLLWEIHFAYAIEGWRRVSGRHVSDWLSALGELEALSSLSAFRFEHPDDVFPEVVTGQAMVSATEVGHPLLLESACVRNDVELSEQVRVWILSGSNMSGKSTLLRAIGVNTVLALAGASVRARRFRVAHMAIGASMKTRDSLLKGTSRFYAEIRHLGEFVKAAKAGPFLFLVDEIFNGTNSHDRTVGTEALVREWVKLGAAGLLTTHDLELTRIADAVSQATNVHLQDEVREGRLYFDYKLRPGVVKRSNALELMRSVGIPV